MPCKKLMRCLPNLFSGERSREHSIEIDEDIRVKLFTYNELRTATNDFSPANKIGEGGFGSVYKGTLKDGTVAAIKVLSDESKQGVRAFLTEVSVISDVVHENLVSLYGVCVEGNHRMLLYNYFENNSLARSLLGSGGHSDIQFSWKTRTKICIGVARGLAYLHEQLQPPILHRDIKASNILLDNDLNPKISDFGLAKLLPPNASHVSTRVAGTLGYLAPEYAVRGQATRKSDVYSFGILLLEIVCGRSNTNTKLPVEDRFLIERAWVLYERNELTQLVDCSLGGEFDEEEARRFMKVGLMCTQETLKGRPSMSSVLKYLTGKRDVSTVTISRPGLLFDFMEGRGKQVSAYRNASSSDATIPTAGSTIPFGSSVSYPSTSTCDGV